MAEAVTAGRIRLLNIHPMTPGPRVPESLVFTVSIKLWERRLAATFKAASEESRRDAAPTEDHQWLLTLSLKPFTFYILPISFIKPIVAIQHFPDLFA